MNASAKTAAAYVAKIHSGNMSSQELEEFENWLTEDEEHIYQYQYLLDAWDALGDYPLMQQEVLELEKKKNIEEPNESKFSKKIFRENKLTTIAASVFLFFFTASISLFNLKEEPLEFRYQTLVGQQKTIVLLDGSVVTLNTDTLLEADFRGGKRNLKLEFGEAFFDVVKDPNSLMQIDLISHKVTVLGTKFSLYRSPLEVKLAVLEGLVSFVSIDDIKGNLNQETLSNSDFKNIDILSTQSQLLAAGDVVNVSVKKNKPIIVEKTDVAELIEWKDGLIRFEKKPLSEVISELNRYSKRKILLEDKKAMSLLVTGISRFDQIETILEAIDISLPVQVVKYSDRYVILEEN